MTKISLRVYNREIEAMIEGGQTDEAIAHCQYILRTFPMHLETYRLLGKGYLETRRYTDAVDIFQRLLMSVPDDFVSHVGMSIIRDDEGKLDEAIWHMERAFEVQPSNPAIQDELRKLYGRRDGIEPPKVRLTRDALANMYTQGALYSQAIAEIRSVLADDPSRPDLQVMLARAYSKDGRKSQAIEICTSLLKKYPYCFDALRILMEIMPATEQHEITQTYRQRIKALDPYAGFVTGSVFESDKVADAAVNLEQLDYIPGEQGSEAQPTWASSLGINLESEQSQKSVPDWLSEKPIEATTEQPSMEDETPPSAELPDEVQSEVENNEIPDWMRSKGWEKQSRSGLENPIADESAFETDEPIARAEIPEWIKTMAPDDEKPDISAPAEKHDFNFEDLTNDNPIELLPAETSEEVGNEFEKSEKVQSEEDFPDWMKEIKTDELNQSSESQPIQENAFIDGSIGEFESATPRGSEETSIEQPVDDVSAWLAESQTDSIAIEPGGIQEGEENLPDWLKDIESNQSGKEKLPEPVSDFFPSESETLSTQEQGEIPPPGLAEADIPEWLKESVPTQGENPVDMQMETTPEGGLEFLSEEMGHENIPETTSGPAEMELGAVSQEPVSIEDQTSPQLIDGGMPSLDDQDAAMAWLESLAAKQGAKSEELLTKPEDRLEEPPEWVRKTIDETPIALKNEELITRSTDAELLESAQPENISPALEEEFAPAKFPTDVDIKAADSFQPEVGVVAEIPGVGYPKEEVDESPSQSQPDLTSEIENRDVAPSENHDELKVADFYGSEASEPLPDWLQDMEKEAGSSEWIPANEGLPELKKDVVEPELISKNKDIEDIGSIFPSDSTEWVFEEKKTEPEFEPISNLVQPVAPGDWLPIQESTVQEYPADQAEVAKVEPFESNVVIRPTSKLPGTGMLSKIPTKEKESDTLELAQMFLEKGNLNQALIEYGRMIKKGHLLEEVIHDLREMIYRYPIDISVWQTLGDACMHANQLQDALDAYTKAEELLR
jgi:tetratricopeptide (TPR) repeat protein